jgi:hypothetical protein
MSSVDDQQPVAVEHKCASSSDQIIALNLLRSKERR